MITVVNNCVTVVRQIKTTKLAPTLTSALATFVCDDDDDDDKLADGEQIEQQMMSSLLGFLSALLFLFFSPSILLRVV